MFWENIIQFYEATMKSFITLPIYFTTDAKIIKENKREKAHLVLENKLINKAIDQEETDEQNAVQILGPVNTGIVV